MLCLRVEEAKGGFPSPSGPVSQTASCDLSRMPHEQGVIQTVQSIPVSGSRATLTWHNMPKVCEELSGNLIMQSQSDAA